MQINLNANAAITIGIIALCTALAWPSTLEVKPDEVKSISEACAKVGKEPLITIHKAQGIKMGCKEK